MQTAQQTHPAPSLHERRRQLERDVIRRHTRAPLRMGGTFRFDAPIQEVFPRFSDPEQIAGWFSLLKGGRADHEGSANPGQWGEGTVRACKTRGMGPLEERIAHWDPPHAYVYLAHNAMMPIEHHAALMLFEPLGAGGTAFGWFHYYDDKGHVLRHLFPTVMLSMMNRGLRKLRRELGGTPGTMSLVSEPRAAKS